MKDLLLLTNIVPNEWNLIKCIVFLQVASWFCKMKAKFGVKVFFNLFVRNLSQSTGVPVWGIGFGDEQLADTFIKIGTFHESLRQIQLQFKGILEG